MPTKAKVFITLAVLPGLMALGWGVTQWESADLLRYFSYLLLAVLASTFKVRLPGITGTMSLNFLFILIGIAQLSFAETITLGCAAALMQCVWKTRTRPRLPQVVFNVAALAVAIASSHFIYHLRIAHQMNSQIPVLLALAACVFFVTNTVLVAAVLSLVETKPLTKVWQQCYIWSFPYYLAGAVIAGLVTVSSQYIGWRTALLILPLAYLIYLHYRLYLEQQTAPGSDINLRAP